MRYFLAHSRFFAAAIASTLLTAIYPYAEADRRFSQNAAVLAAMLSLYLCPFIVTLIAGSRFVLWGVATNILLFIWLFFQVYVLGQGLASFRKDLLGLAVFCSFGLLSGALVGSFVQRHIRRQHAV
jgi:putative membrane protein (TIGR04086 family)